MALEDNLTKIQKVALKGEIAYIVSTSCHNAEIKYRLYKILKEASSEDRAILLEAFKEATDIKEDELNRIFLEVSSEEVPVWLWIEKAISDIKEAISYGELAPIGAHLSINKSEERKNIIESAFVYFAREALLLSPSSANELLTNILEDNKLSFLHTSCYYLKDGYREIQEKNFIEEKEVPEELMELTFDIREILCYKIETKSLEEINNNPLQKTKAFKEAVTPTKKRSQKQPIHQEIIRFEGSISPSELSNFLSQKITELFQEVSNIEENNISYSKDVQPQEDPRISYVVQKVFNNTNIKTDIKECATAEEAREFIEQVKKEYPELQATCNFIICRKRK